MRMIATDLDGTLLGRSGKISERNQESLHDLGRRGVVRVIATGRSAFSARRVLPRSLPIDYLVVSSGAGVIDWASDRYVRTLEMAPAQTHRATRLLASMELDFMVHDVMPNNHRFVFHRAQGCADFERRVALYQDHCGPHHGSFARAACQLLGVHGPAHDNERVDEVASELHDFTVLRTTSPLDHASVWIEVFPAVVSKSQACAWVAARHSLSANDVLAVGNDTNDLDLLRWARRGLVVANAHPKLLAEFERVAACCRDGFSDAAARLDLA